MGKTLLYKAMGWKMERYLKVIQSAPEILIEATDKADLIRRLAKADYDRLELALAALVVGGMIREVEADGCDSCKTKVRELNVMEGSDAAN